MLSDETDFKTMISIESHQQGNNTIKVFLVERKERCFGSGISKKSCLRKNSGSRSPKNQKRLTFDENIKIESNSTTREAAKATPKVEETKSSATSTNPKSGKTNSLQACVISDVVSEAGEKVSLSKNSFVTVQRILQKRGLVEVNCEGKKAYFPALKFKIMEQPLQCLSKCKEVMQNNGVSFGEEKPMYQVESLVQSFS